VVRSATLQAPPTPFGQSRNVNSANFASFKLSCASPQLLSYRFISARSCAADSGGNIDKAAFIPCSERSRAASALSLPTAPTCTPKKALTTVPTKLATAPTTVATLVTSLHLNVAIRVIKKTRAKPVMMIQNPYLSLSRSISSEVGAGVVPCISTTGSILSASFT
jgi:hypothetical protein